MVDVTFEPSKLGDTRTNLVLSSPTGGDYICPLYGHCVAPRPQGPIIVKPGGPTSVPFKNVFSNPAMFTFIVDNPAFTVKGNESIGTKKTVNISIMYKGVTPTAESSLRGVGSAKGAQSKVAKLTIMCQNPSISWVYYLRCEGK